jgi:hypothetical protein
MSIEVLKEGSELLAASLPRALHMFRISAAGGSASGRTDH